MSLCPSNMIAEEVNGGTQVFPNLARRITTFAGGGDIPVPDAAQIIKDTTAVVRAELVAAGIPEKMDKRGRVGCFDLELRPESLRREVPTSLVGFFNHWKFERNWYYYVATGAGIPPEFAVPFDKEWGKEVRVDGDCACRGAEFWGEGFAIGSYHIDTPRGLKAFIELLGKIYAPRE